jgi:hypothetical protein
MAQKRMFTLQIVDTDAFLEMPTSTQNLYFHLCMRADDDGFIDNAKKIMKMVNASEDDLKILLAKRFLLGFDGGIIVIKHWRMHNYISKDRYKETVYTDEKKKLSVKENGSYTECIQNVYEMSTQIRLDKISIDKNRLDKNIKEDRTEIISDNSKVDANIKKSINDFYLTFKSQSDINKFIFGNGKELKQYHNLIADLRGLTESEMQTFFENVKSDKWLMSCGAVPSLLVSQFSKINMKKNNRQEYETDYAKMNPEPESYLDKLPKCEKEINGF